MARTSYGFPIIMGVLLLVSAVAMVSSEVIDESEGPAPYEYDEGANEYSPKPAPEMLNLFENCMKKISKPCGKQIFRSIFLNNGTKASHHCCQELVLMGKHCHTEMVKYATTLLELKANASEALPKSERVWNECVSVAASPSPTPSSSS